MQVKTINELAFLLIDHACYSSGTCANTRALAPSHSKGKLNFMLVSACTNTYNTKLRLMNRNMKCQSSQASTYINLTSCLSGPKHESEVSSNSSFRS